LIGSFAATDLRNVSPADLYRCGQLSVHAFLVKKYGPSHVMPVTVQRTATLEDVSCWEDDVSTVSVNHQFCTFHQVNMMLTENRVHLVCVVDADRHILGVVTLTDVLCKVID